MSRNFELMTQLEVEAGATNASASNEESRTLTLDVVPILSRHAGNSSGEEILRLIQRIFLSANGSAARQVVLCGIDNENGSSSVCAKAGRTLAANSSRPVCVVDANVRSPRLSSLFGIEGTNPFSGPAAPLRDQCVKISSNLWLAGPNILADNSRVLLPPVQLRERLAQLRKEFEYMLIDAPGTSVCGDAQLLGLVTDAAILVIEAHSTRRLTARKAKEIFDATGVRLLGTVLHDRAFPIPKWLYKAL
jgi:Mrp family chromosome partitioning ATPase